MSEHTVEGRALMSELYAGAQPPLVPQPPLAPQPPKKGPPWWVWLLVAVLAILVISAVALTAFFFLRGAEQPADDEPAPTSPVQTTEPAPTPTPEPAAATTIPNCATLHPVAQQASDEVVAQFGADAFSPPPGEVGRAEFDQQFGPVAQRTMDKASDMRGCLYIFSFHDGLYQYVSVVSPNDQLELVQALQADADFVQSTIGSAQLYSWGDEVEGFGTYYTIHTFIGDVWIAAVTSTEPTAAMTPVVDAMVAANPSLNG